MALLRAQIGPNSEFLANFSAALPAILTGYEQRFNVQGLDAVRDLGAIYGALRPAAKSPKDAAAHLQALVAGVIDPQKATDLQAFGINVMGRTQEEANANFLLGRRRPLQEWFPQLLATAGGHGRMLPLQLDALMGTDISDLLRRVGRRT